MVLGQAFQGPVVVEEASATTVVPPGTSRASTIWATS